MSSQNNEVPEGFKMTDMGLLPAEWQTTKMEGVASLTTKPRELGISNCEMVPFIPMEAISNDGSGHFQYHAKPGKDITSGVYCERGDLLLAKITPCLENGKQCLLSFSKLPSSFAYATTEVYPLKINMEIADAQYVFYYLLYPPVRRDLASKMEGTTGRQRLPKHIVRNMLLPLPPLPEQKAITRVLSTIQKAIETQDKIVAAARELKKSLMHHLFTYGPVPVFEAEKVSLKETEIGPVPEHWKHGRLDTFFTFQRGFDLPTQNRISGTVPIVSSSGITGFHIESKVPGPGVVTGRYGTLGKVFFIGPDFWPLNTTLFVKDFKGNDPQFVAAFLSGIKLNDFNDKTSVPGINRNAIHALTVAFPLCKEQKEIARMLSAVDKKIESEENRKSALQALFKTMLHLLMTGKVRVKGKIGEF